MIMNNDLYALLASEMRRVSNVLESKDLHKNRIKPDIEIIKLIGTNSHLLNLISDEVDDVHFIINYMLVLIQLGVIWA